MQRFSPRRKNSQWTELNKERVRRLEALGLMTPLGRKVLPPMAIDNFKFAPDIELALKKAMFGISSSNFLLYINE